MFIPEKESAENEENQRELDNMKEKSPKKPFIHFISVPLHIDFTLLKHQKIRLYKYLDKDPDLFEGILSLIDTIQDIAVDFHGIPEEEVMNLYDNDNYIPNEEAIPKKMHHDETLLRNDDR